MLLTLHFIDFDIVEECLMVLIINVLPDVGVV